MIFAQFSFFLKKISGEIGATYQDEFFFTYVHQFHHMSCLKKMFTNENQIIFQVVKYWAHHSHSMIFGHFFLILSTKAQFQFFWITVT